MDDDPELIAIRKRLREELAQAAAAATAATVPPPERAPDIDAPLEATDATLQALVETHETLVVDCWAPWCGPCRIVGPIVDDLARDMAGQVVFAKLNVDHNPQTSRAFQVQSIPTLLVFREGRLVERLVGALPKPQLKARIQRHVEGRGHGSTPGPRR